MIDRGKLTRLKFTLVRHVRCSKWKLNCPEKTTLTDFKFLTYFKFAYCHATIMYHQNDEKNIYKMCFVCNNIN